MGRMAWRLMVDTIAEGTTPHRTDVAREGLAHRWPHLLVASWIINSDRPSDAKGWVERWRFERESGPEKP